MKKTAKVLSLALALCLLFSLVSASSAEPVYRNIKITIDGETLTPKDANGNIVEPFILDGSTYLPVRAIAGAFDLAIAWDGDSRTVFIDGQIGNPARGDEVNIYIKGQSFQAKDATGKNVYPVIINGSTFLPVRAIAEAFDKEVDWDGATSTVIIASKIIEIAVADGAAAPQAGVEYFVVNAASGQKLSIVGGAGAQAGAPLQGVSASTEAEVWTLEANGSYYQFINKATGFGMDINGVSVDPGAKAIVWNKSGDDNQQFALKQLAPGLYSISAKHSNLPIEMTSGEVVQNSVSSNAAQQWSFVPATDVAPEL